MRAGLPLLLLLSSCAAPPADAPGEHPTIVSLNPCADAILADIAAPGQLLAISHYSHDPEASSMLPEDAARYASTGGTAEEVIALAPDIVVADSFLSPSRREAFERAGIEVVQIGIATTLEESLSQIEQLGMLAGQEAAGNALSLQIESAWQLARSDAQPVRTLLWQQGGIVAGEDSLAFAMLEQAGFSSHSAARGLGQGAYVPLEQVMADPPELVLAAGDEPMLRHPVLRQLDGAHYETFDSALLYCGGPTIPRALERLRAIRAGIE